MLARIVNCKLGMWGVAAGAVTCAISLAHRTPSNSKPANPPARAAVSSTSHDLDRDSFSKAEMPGKPADDADRPAPNRVDLASEFVADAGLTAAAGESDTQEPATFPVEAQNLQPLVCDPVEGQAAEYPEAEGGGAGPECTACCDSSSASDGGSEPRVCILRNLQTNERLATLKISGEIQTSRIDPAELVDEPAESPETDTRCEGRRTPTPSLMPREKPDFRIERQDDLQLFEMEANDLEIVELARRVSEAAAVVVMCDIDVSGTVSAHVRDRTIVGALQRLLEPFGFVLVSRGDDSLLVCRADRAASRAADIRPVSHMVHGPTAVTEVSLPDSNAASTGESPTVRSVRLPPVDTVASVKRDGLGAPSLDRPFGKAPPNAMIDSYELQLAQLARQRVERGQVNESIDLVSNAVAKRPDSAFLYRLLGESYLRRGDYTLAEKAIQRSLGLNKSDAETNRLYAQVLFALGQHDRANHYRQRSADLVSMQSTENSPASTRGVGRID